MLAGDRSTCSTRDRCCSIRSTRRRTSPARAAGAIVGSPTEKAGVFPLESSS
jgi:hypothetical protein